VDASGRLRPGVTGFQNEAFIKHIADFVNSSGLQALGFSNINMDSLWDLPTRDANGDLQPDPALWPSGFDYIVDYVHGRGLGFGVYGDRGNLDCNKNPGQLGHEEQDAAFFAKHGIDWFKSDSCECAPCTRAHARTLTHKPQPP
jgi:alpha-galactosidase